MIAATFITAVLLAMALGWIAAEVQHEAMLDRQHRARRRAWKYAIGMEVARTMIDLARALKPMTDDERERQRRSFAFGNVSIHNPDVTREMVDEVAEKMIDEEVAKARSKYRAPRPWSSERGGT